MEKINKKQTWLNSVVYSALLKKIDLDNKEAFNFDKVIYPYTWREDKATLVMVRRLNQSQCHANWHLPRMGLSRRTKIVPPPLIDTIDYFEVDHPGFTV